MIEIAYVTTHVLNSTSINTFKSLLDNYLLDSRFIIVYQYSIDQVYRLIMIIIINTY